MDYKKIIKNRETRLKILSLLNWIPDKYMLMLQYRIKTGRKLNLKDPKRYTEKIQWYKLNYRDPIMAKCADKYTVREYIKDIGLSDILNEIYQVYNSSEEIDFDKLPEEFVLKSTNGGGGNEVIICRDKSNLDKEEVLKRVSNWTIKHNNGGGREWVYYKSNTRIIAEKLIKAKENDLVDYKFFCFNGEVQYIYVINGRNFGGKSSLGIFDTNFNKLDYCRVDENSMNEVPKKPDNFKEMIKISEVIARDFPHVRVDLYDNDGKIIFGEITFFDGSGYQTYRPDEFDYILGEKFKLPKIKRR